MPWLVFDWGFPKWKDWMGLWPVLKRECGFLCCSLISENYRDEITSAGQAEPSKKRGWYSVPTQAIRLIPGQCQHFDGTFWCSLSSVTSPVPRLLQPGQRQSVKTFWHSYFVFITLCPLMTKVNFFAVMRAEVEVAVKEAGGCVSMYCAIRKDWALGHFFLKSCQQ